MNRARLTAVACLHTYVVDVPANPCTGYTGPGSTLSLLACQGYRV